MAEEEKAAPPAPPATGCSPSSLASQLGIDDARVEIVADYLLRNYKLKPDRWVKFYNNPENRKQLHNFFEDPEFTSTVLIFTCGTNSIDFSFNWPGDPQQKFSYFIKRNPKSKLTKDNFRELVTYGDMFPGVLENFSQFLQRAVDRPVGDLVNSSMWPHVVTDHVQQQITNLKTRVDIVASKTKGQTLLRVPDGFEEFEYPGDMNFMGKTDPQELHRVEAMIVMWSNEIQDVLAYHCADPILEGTNPTPQVELKYWKDRAKDLDHIYQQLVDPTVKHMVRFLKANNSVYYLGFKEIYSKIVEALLEANDNCMYLKTLANAMDNAEGADFEECSKFMGPLVHTVGLIWANSNHYNTPERITVLLQMLCNFVIAMVDNYLRPEEMFRGDIAETIPAVKLAEGVMSHFRKAFDMTRKRLPTMFRDGRPPVPWTFEPDLVFARFTKVHERLKTAFYLMDTYVNFMKLEKVELGGIKGNMLGEQVIDIFQEFDEAFKLFTESKYNPLDSSDPSFLENFHKFNRMMKDFDRRLATIVVKGYYDCTGLESIFKLIDMMGPLLERQLIMEDFNDKYPEVVTMMHKELDTCFELFEEQMAYKKETGKMRVHKNMPPMAGAMIWAREVYSRVNVHMEQYIRLEHPIKKTEEYKHVFTRLEDLKNLLEQNDLFYYNNWLSTVDENCNYHMSQPLLTEDKTTKLLSVNFHPNLMAVLKEMKYLKLRNKEVIPEIPEAVFAKRDMLFKYYSNMMLLSQLYNHLITDALDVEKPLMAPALERINKQLQGALTDKTWEMEDIWDYIAASLAMVQDLTKRVRETKDNIERIRGILAALAVTPLFERKEKQDNLLGLSDRQEAVKRRQSDIIAAGVEIHELMEANALLYDANPKSPEWLAYVNHLDSIVEAGCASIIGCSIRYLLDNTNPEKTVGPLLEILLELHAPKMTFIPDIEPGSQEGFWALLDSLAVDIEAQASLIPRLKPKETMTYQNLLESNDELIEMRHALTEAVESATSEVVQYRETLNTYSGLWVEDRQEFMQLFLLYNHKPTTEEISLAGEAGIPENPPTLQQFKAMIELYENLYEEIEQLQAVQVFNKWLRVDARVFKQGLLGVVKKWSQMFKQHLIDRVTGGLDNLQEFITSTSKGLAKEPEDGDYAGLVNVMGLLNAVRDRQAETDVMFEPLKQTIDMLKTCGVDMSEKVYNQLEELPDKWAQLKKKVMLMKQGVVPLQQNQAAKIKRKLISFDVKQHNYREAFRKCKAFFYDCEKPYTIINNCHEEITEMEKEMNELIDQSGIFEVTLPEFKQLKACRSELRSLKILWDYVTMIRMMFEHWNTVLWNDIDVEQMDIDCKKLAKEIRGLDKEMRSWDVYLGIENALKNMITSLRAVGELQNPAIRERHWKELMDATKVTFKMDEKTTLRDLLQLNLHRFEDDVHGIVDKAVKETSMEKTLREFGITWANMEFVHTTHPRTGITLINAEEEVIETLEDNQVQLQNMMTSKYIAHFLEQVSSWQHKLSVTDQVIQIYMQVQRTWMHLESIFIGSEDIRRQLPEDTDRFERVDANFKALAKDISVTTIVVDACNLPGLYDKLESIQAELVKCEKALAEYLETKRLAFPRFYFVSSADLLDILSNGNNPPVVAKQLTKLFDSLANLDFAKNNKYQALAMFSKEGEVVKLDTKCDLSGQVEAWLCRVEESMKSTIRHVMGEAVAAYEEKPREKWVFEYPAQPALCGTQIWWTTEVNQAFVKLEEGHEAALKDYLKKQIAQLNNLITLLLGELSAGDRQKIMTICTIDVHARDVVAKMINLKVDNSQCFVWLSQLRHRWDIKEDDCFANICDAQFRYDKEYLGNTPRLVITPLTDRCYITLTQSLHLIMGGAPAGPAGTGKTETTKDLGRALGMMVYVFNCSEQMDYKSVGNIFKGLSQSGAWGCFDEFNRIAVEVLSVIAVQVKSIQDAIRDKKRRFNFMGENIKLIPTVGAFITMNPGYAGRAELPENLKALFRPCAMVVPDFELICEIMLVAEGFMEARLLARKFITLYSLCKELLSKQDHYDWGLRAIKSVLVVAGSLKRGDRQRPEDQVLMRALRDFNVPKIVVDDMPVFMGLIGDLFPALDVPRKRDLEFEKQIKTATLQLKLQPEDNFILKVVQLQELFDVRHSVFILGNAGTGKSCVWNSLKQTNKILGKKPIAVDLDPKSVTNDELFGIISPATREWKDGLFSVVMRDLANMTGDGPRWIVLDGDIDPMWIESLNTVMDDNKVLTLASNERITMTKTMRLLFEISNLRTATPATVSRAGILFINQNDIGWNPYVQSWIDKREVPHEKANLTLLFDKYVPSILDTLRVRFKKITPIQEIAHVQMLTYLLEVMLTDDNCPSDSPKDVFELYFVFCCVWAFGGSMFQDQLCDHRVDFTKWFTVEYKTVKFPPHGTVFDYYICPQSRTFKPWTNLVPDFEFDPDLPLQ
ncbi:dynein heavy chain 17, axonemal, partial [Elysia marginata]